MKEGETTNDLFGFLAMSNSQFNSLTSAVNENHILNHDTAGDYGIRLESGSQGIGGTGQDFTNNDTDHSADSTTYAYGS